VQFVNEAEIDPIYYEHSYYVGPGDEVSKPYALFMRALKDSKYSAIAKVSMHSREHVVIIRATDDQLILHTMFYEDELHRANRQKIPAKANSTRQELELAAQLINHLAGPFKPGDYSDTYRQNVETLIRQKKKGQSITTESKPKRAPVVDLMEALKKSLKASESHTERVRKPKAAARKTRRKAA